MNSFVFYYDIPLISETIDELGREYRKLGIKNIQKIKKQIFKYNLPPLKICMFI
jgi:hypothetical protein